MPIISELHYELEPNFEFIASESQETALATHSNDQRANHLIMTHPSKMDLHQLNGIALPQSEGDQGPLLIWINFNPSMNGTHPL